jgi:hypothetical protein
MPTTLEKLKDLLNALKPGETARISNDDLVAAEIPEIAEADHKTRAEWLEKQLPFRCEIKEAPDTGAVMFTRSK